MTDAVLEQGESQTDSQPITQSNGHIVASMNQPNIQMTEDESLRTKTESVNQTMPKSMSTRKFVKRSTFNHSNVLK
jgi:hypothetical protein